MTHADTHQAQLEAVRQKIVEANPEILELKFGCMITWTYCNGRYYEEPSEENMVVRTGTIVHKQSEAGERWVLFDHSGYLDNPHDCHMRKLSDLPSDEVRVLGRPIRLADVLLASNERYQTGASPKWSAVLTCWNLRSDSLDAQSPETIAFLHSLLCND